MQRTVLQVVQHLCPGGIETMALELQQYLPSDDVHIVSLEGNAETSLQQWPRLAKLKKNLHFLDKKPGVSPATFLDLSKLMHRLNVHAVHTHHIGPLTYAGISARFCRIKHLVHTEHDSWHLESPKAARLEKRLIHLLNPTLVADCSLVSRKLQELFKGVAPSIIYNGVDTKHFSPASPSEKRRARKAFGLPKNVPLIGCAARLEKVKGVSYLIDALTYLPENIHLAIAGTGSQREHLISKVKANNSEHRVFFLGRVEEMSSFYRSLDLFCLPSLNEGFPLSPLEAQSCAIPAVLTDVGGASEALCPKTGDLVPSANAAELARALKNKLTHPPQDSPRPFVEKLSDVRRMSKAYAKLLAL